MRRSIFIIRASGTSSSAGSKVLLVLSPKAKQAFLNTGVSTEIVAPIYDENADTSVLPNTTGDIDSSRYLFPVACGNEALDHTVPAYAMEAKEPTTQIDVLMTGDHNAAGAFVWYMNNVTCYTDYNDPSLFEAKLGNYDQPKERQIYDMATKCAHLHGHNMQIPAEGLGIWNGSIVDPRNSQRRDSQLIRAQGYLVVQSSLTTQAFGLCTVTLPGTHLRMPYVMAQTCGDWTAWSKTTVVPMIDSGL
ncbi:hypothetical protein KC316_g1839 [Hortaea werneckii]|nr:hypothetical protein KC324_g1765 [Hortaea werneckii]KAI7593276.1 hypothetical protein KC316_g1839 [Hortaea werneckii]